MKKVVTLFAIAVAMLTAGSAKAQLNLHLGYMPETFSDEVGSASSDFTMDGFFVGADYMMNLTGDLNLSVGLQLRYNMHSETVATIETKFSQMALDVPILFNYGFPLGSDFKLSAFAGPTISFAIMGKSKATILGTETETDWYENNENLSRLNVYGTVGLSLSYKGQYRLFGGYNMGLLDLEQSDNSKRTTGGLFVGLGIGL